MIDSTPALVPGHGLAAEGAPHDRDGSRRQDYPWMGIGGPGRAKCSCGALSEVLPSSTRRRRWHREHKAEVLSAAARLGGPA